MQVYLNKNEVTTCIFFPLNKGSTNFLQFRILYREKGIRDIRHKKVFLKSIMKNEEIVLKIIKQTGLSRKEIYEMIEKKKKKFKSLKSDFLVLSQIVKDLCITL